MKLSQSSCVVWHCTGKVKLTEIKGKLVVGLNIADDHQPVLGEDLEGRSKKEKLVAVLEVIRESFETSLCSKLPDHVPYPNIF